MRDIYPEKITKNTVEIFKQICSSVNMTKKQTQDFMYKIGVVDKKGNIEKQFSTVFKKKDDKL